MENSVAASATKASTGEPSLDAIGVHYGTDKSSIHHNFLVFYERFFAPLRRKSNVRVLEIGVHAGGSLRTWEDYFPNATIIAADNNPVTLQQASPRSTIVLADQSNIADMTALALAHGPFDLVIEDGSHFWDHQITTWQTIYPFVKPGGYYVMEDIDTSYGHYIPHYCNIATQTAASYLQMFCDALVADTAVDQSKQADAFIRSYAPLTDFMAFHRRTCVIQRR